MKVRWKEHELIAVTVTGALFLGVYLWHLFSRTPAQIASEYITPFKQNQVPFDLFRNVLLPDLGLALIGYLLYLVINLFAIPRLWHASGNDRLDAVSKWIKRLLATLLLVALLILILGSASVWAVYLRDEWRFHYPGFSVFFKGHNPHDNINFSNAFNDVFVSVALYLAYAALREVLMAYIGRPGEKRAYRVLIANRVTAFLGIYLLFILFELVILGVPAASPVTRLYAASITSVLLVFLNTYWLFPADQKQTLFNRRLFTRLLLLSFICTIPVPFFFGFGKVVPFFLLGWAFQLLVVTPVSWLFYQQQKEKILAFRSLEKALVKSNTDLQFLRSQVNPHFLFNALNTVYASALREEAEQTAESIQMLGEMMRFMLHENNRDFIPLKKEVEYLQNYIALQKLRLTEAAQAEIGVTIGEDFPDYQIAPMLLIPFVENAFKHGLSLKERSWIKIMFQVNAGRLHFEATNSIHTHAGNDPENAPSGVGLANVRERLTLIYPDKHTLIARREGDEFVVKLQIELQIIKNHKRKNK